MATLTSGLADVEGEARAGERTVDRAIAAVVAPIARRLLDQGRELQCQLWQTQAALNCRQRSLLADPLWEEINRAFMPGDTANERRRIAVQGIEERWRAYLAELRNNSNAEPPA